MRIAVFTSQFPSKQCTFFSRDIRGLLENGIDIDIFPIYSVDLNLWQYVPKILNENNLSRSKVHNISIKQSLVPALRIYPKNVFVIKEIYSILYSATKFGFSPLIKSSYVVIKAAGWAVLNQGKYDHIFGYWGNYAATCAYLFNHLINRNCPYSIFLHAGTDLYRDQVFLKQKLLYANNIFVECQFNRNFIQELYPNIYPKISEKIQVYYGGLDFREFPFLPQNRPSNKIIAVGSLTNLKGFDFLLDAVKELVTRGIDVYLDLIGDGEEETNLKELVVKLGISDRVNFLGWLSFEEVKKAMLAATLLVHPSRDLGDAVPNVIKEAMALGTPVIASNIAGIPELLEHGKCGELVPPRDVKALANAIEKLLQNEPLRSEYALAARNFGEEKFDLWKNSKLLSLQLKPDMQ